jgi:hypothetical protein
MLRTGRITSALVVAGGLLFAFLFPTVVNGLIVTWKFLAYLGVAFWFGVIWKRANRYGAWTSTISMIIASVITDNILGWSLPYQIATYLPVGIFMMWIVSYLTPPEPEEKLRQFYTLLDTPVGKEKRLHDANVEVKLEGVSEPKAPRKGSVLTEGPLKEKETEVSGSEAPQENSLLTKYLTKDEEVEDGLLLVDLLDLKEKFSWKRYRTDILGFLAGMGIVAILIIALLFVAQIGA